jgi:Family of unknown function (DUF5335)
MPMRELTRAEWRPFCDRVSKSLGGRQVELDVASLDLGDRVASRWLPLQGIVFDPRADALSIALDGVGHSILAPREVHLEETERGIVSIEIIAADESVETLRFREPLRLEAPTPMVNGRR